MEREEMREERGEGRELRGFSVLITCNRGTNEVEGDGEGSRSPSNPAINSTL
jgi:hypothetical protein